MTSPHQPSKGRACAPQLDGCAPHVVEAVLRSEQKPKTSAAKTRVLYGDPVADAYGKAPSFRSTKDYWHTVPHVVTECPSLKSARARKKWEEMSQEEKIIALAGAIARMESNRYGRRLTVLPLREQIARAVLAVTEGRG